MKIYVSILAVAIAMFLFNTSCLAMEHGQENSVACEIRSVFKCEDLGGCVNLTTSEAKLPRVVFIELASKKVIDPTMKNFTKQAFLQYLLPTK